MDKKIEYRYEYANGDAVVLTAEGGVADRSSQISEEWIRILQELDRQEYNNTHAETRRHCSLNALDPDEYYLTSGKDGFDDLEAGFLWEEMKELLTETEIEVAWRVFIEGYSVKEAMAMLGLGRSRMYELVGSVRKKLKKFSE